MQYTIRNIPARVDEWARRRAREEGRSLNEIIVEAIARGFGLTDDPVRQRDLTDIAGTWIEDPEFEAALGDQHRVDEDLWR